MKKQLKQLRRRIEDRGIEIYFPWAIEEKLSGYKGEYKIRKDGCSGIGLFGLGEAKSYAWAEVKIPVCREHLSFITAEIKFMMTYYHVSGHKTEVNSFLSIPYFANKEETLCKLRSLLDRLEK